MDHVACIGTSRIWWQLLISQKLLKLLGPSSDVNFNRVRILIPRFWRFFCSLIYHHYSTLYLYKQNLETVLNELLFFHRNTKQGKSIKVDHLGLVWSEQQATILSQILKSKTFDSQNISTWGSKTGEGVTESRFLNKKRKYFLKFS